jgi:hypothetical protein
MKLYVLTTGSLFALLALAHLWRIIFESPQLASDPWFVSLTILAALLSIWAFYTASRAPRG